MNEKLHLTYPAFYSSDGQYIMVEVPDLGIKPFLISEANRAALADITWELAAQTVQKMLSQGEPLPPCRTLEDLEVSEDEDRDAFLIELISQ